MNVFTPYFTLFICFLYLTVNNLINYGSLFGNKITSRLSSNIAIFRRILFRNLCTFPSRFSVRFCCSGFRLNCRKIVFIFIFTQRDFNLLFIVDLNLKNRIKPIWIELNLTETKHLIPYQPFKIVSIIVNTCM